VHTLCERSLAYLRAPQSFCAPTSIIIAIIMGEEKLSLTECFGCDEAVAWKPGNVHIEMFRQNGNEG
jgi:hypothetical protein